MQHQLLEMKSGVLIRHRRTWGQVGHWISDDTDPATAPDHSGNLNHGTITGAVWAAGNRGRALSFDGVDDYVDVGNYASLDFSGQNKTTMSAWIKLASNPTDTVIIADDRQKFIQISIGRKLILGGFIDGGYRLLQGAAVNTVLSLEKWYHIVFTYDGSNMYGYINGVNDGGVSQTGEFGYGSSDHKMYFAKYSGGLHFNGTIDEVRIWNRALSASEVLDEYNNRRKRYGL